MEVIKQDGEFGFKIILENGNKYITISIEGNGDLYWSFHSDDVTKDSSFVITKDNYEVYKLFEQLFDDISNINIIDDFHIPFYIETEEEKREYLEDLKEKIETEKERYRLYNCSNYNNLFDKDSNVITWHSDETAYEVSNVLRICKGDSFKLEFYVQPYVDGYDRDFSSLHYIPIRFRNSGSSYAPFNRLFMIMYRNMKDLDNGFMLKKSR